MRNEEPKCVIPHSLYSSPPIPHSSFLKTAHLKDYTGDHKENVEENNKSPGYPLDMNRRSEIQDEKDEEFERF
jgi:hypothetical protein